MSVVVRPPVVGDMRAIETVRITGWKAAYRGLLPDALLDGLEVTEERVSRWVETFEAGQPQLCVAADGASVVGFAAAGRCRDEDLPAARELWALYVLPEWWGTGTGAALVEAVGPLDVVWVLEGNARAMAFYARQGFRADGTSRRFERLGASVPELRYTRP